MFKGVICAKDSLEGSRIQLPDFLVDDCFQILYQQGFALFFEQAGSEAAQGGVERVSDRGAGSADRAEDSGAVEDSIFFVDEESAPKRGYLKV